MASEWHPFLLLTETEPGVWTMKHATDYAAFGRVELRRTDAGPRYKVTLGNDVIGWGTSLRHSSERLWRAYLDKGVQARKGPPNGR